MWGVWELLRPIAVLLFVYIPGLLLVQWALSEASRLTRISVAAGIAPILLGWLLVIQSLLGIDVSNFAIIGGLLVMDLVFAGMIIWRNPQGFQRPWARLREKSQRVKNRLQSLSLADRQTSLSNSAMFFMAIVVVPLSATYMTRLQKETFSEFLIVEQNPDVALWRRAIPLDEVLPLDVEVRSTEGRAVEFSARLWTLDEEVDHISLGTVQPGERVVGTLTIPPRVEKVQRFMVTLHMNEPELNKDELDGDQQDVDPHRELFFWISTSVNR